MVRNEIEPDSRNKDASKESVETKHILTGIEIEIPQRNGMIAHRQL